MHKRMKIACLIATLGCWYGAANAQSVVHAVGGTITGSPSAGAITLNLDDGTSGSFNFLATPDAKLTFPEDVRAETAPPDKPVANGSHVILYYIWNSDGKAAVAVQSLGSGPFEKVTGTILKFDKHAHDLTLRTADGKTENILVASKTVVDTVDGVEEGAQYRAEKGDHVRLLAESKNGNVEALFIRPEGDD